MTQERSNVVPVQFFVQTLPNVKVVVRHRLNADVNVCTEELGKLFSNLLTVYGAIGDQAHSKISAIVANKEVQELFQFGTHERFAAHEVNTA